MWKSNSTSQNLSGLSQNQRLTLFAFECCRLATLLNTSCSTNLNSMRNNWTVKLLNADTCKHNRTVKHRSTDKTKLFNPLNANTCKHAQTHFYPQRSKYKHNRIGKTFKRKHIWTLNDLNASIYNHNRIVKTSKGKHMQEQDCLKAARHASAHFGDHVENKSFAR